jgi:hypothetical protein
MTGESPCCLPATPTRTSVLRRGFPRTTARARPCAPAASPTHSCDVAVIWRTLRLHSEVMPPCHAPPTDACASRPSPRRKAIAGAVAGLLALLPLACSARGDDPGDDDSTGASDSADDTSPTTGEVDYPETLVGTFQVQLVAPVPASDTSPATAGKTSVVGKVYDAATPRRDRLGVRHQVGRLPDLHPAGPLLRHPVRRLGRLRRGQHLRALPDRRQRRHRHRQRPEDQRRRQRIHDGADRQQLPAARHRHAPLSPPSPRATSSAARGRRATAPTSRASRSDGRGIAPLTVLANDAIQVADEHPRRLDLDPRRRPRGPARA